MTVDNNLQFIREKIYEIKTAVMYSMSDGVVRLPNSIVSVVKVDDEAQLWFLCTPPVRQLDPAECIFPARLHFYRKGKFFHVEVSGKATIMNNETSSQSGEKPLLIKMSMTNVEYSQAQEKRPRGRVEQLLGDTYKWLIRNIAIPRHEKSVLSKLH